MKRAILLITVFTALIACKNQSGNSANKSEADSVLAAKKANALTDSANFTTAVWVDSTYKDIGKVKKGETVEIAYTIKNTGDKPLIISSVEPGCGCTLGEKPEEPIMPGKEGKVVAKFNSEGQMVGAHNKNMVVKANTKPFTEHVLNFKVEVVE